MNNFHIYSFKWINNKSERKFCTVVFCPNENIHISALKSEIKTYFENNPQPDEFIVIGGNYLEESLTDIFVKDEKNITKEFPNFIKSHYLEVLKVIQFDKDGKIKYLYGKENKTLYDIAINEGLISIFKNGNGLIESQDSHHFVFPSGKHCNKFLRTGNVLIHSSEIFFIAFNLLKYFNENEHDAIICDTSSINSIAFALVELKRKFLGNSFATPNIDSFGSYEKFEESKFQSGNPLILVSASTSGGIIERIEPKVSTMKSIVILFLLAKEYSLLAPVICNLKKDDKTNPNGLATLDTFSLGTGCTYCESGSVPVKVMGDVFLLDKPEIKRKTIKVADAPKGLSEFVHRYMSSEKIKNNIFKCHFKEKTSWDKAYEVFFDLKDVINDGTKYPHFWERFKHVINQYVPANTLYIIRLNDEDSKAMCEHALTLIPKTISESIEIIDYDDLADVDLKGKVGAVVVFCSCMVRGKNLLYISKALRQYETLSVNYIVGLSRTKNEESLNFIKSNLTQGKYGKNTSTFAEIECFFMDDKSLNSSWSVEVDFIKVVLSGRTNNSEFTNFLSARLAILSNAKSNRGLSNDIFLLNPISNKPLFLNNNFAFFNFKEYVANVSQADVYFTINSIINNIRNSNNLNECLKQTEYVRNIIAPKNFLRYNDGIIQAAILRSSTGLELAYDLEFKDSSEIKVVIENLIEHANEVSSDGLIEFLYAISTFKLRIKLIHLKELCDLIDIKIQNNVILGFNEFIKQNLFDSKKRAELYNQFNKPLF